MWSKLPAHDGGPVRLRATNSGTRAEPLLAVGQETPQPTAGTRGAVWMRRHGLTTPMIESTSPLASLRLVADLGLGAMPLSSLKGSATEGQFRVPRAEARLH